MAPALVTCPHCACHAKSTEASCPSCGEPLRRSDGSVPRAAVAVLLGLTAAGALAGSCTQAVALYGVAITTSGTGGSGTGGGDTGGTDAGGTDAGNGG